MKLNLNQLSGKLILSLGPIYALIDFNVFLRRTTDDLLIPVNCSIVRGEICVLESS